MRINPIHRQIIYEGTSIEKYNEIQSKLEEENIAYEPIVNKVNHDYPLSKGQEIGASQSERIDLSRVYMIYIHNKDFKQAKEALRKNK